MADRWLYIHAGAAHGPVELEKLAQLASQGKLLPTDRVWRVGADMRGAVEAHTLLNAESFRAVQAKVEESLANPPQPTSATPDWLTDVAALSEPAPASVPPSSSDEELVIVDETPEVVEDEPVLLAEPIKVPKPSSRAAPKRPAAPKRKAAPDEPDEDEDDAEEGGLGFRRRDLVAFGLGVVGVCLAAGIGLFFAKPWQRKADEAPPKDDGGEAKP
jgi:hypothetical protein